MNRRLAIHLGVIAAFFIWIFLAVLSWSHLMDAVGYAPPWLKDLVEAVTCAVLSFLAFQLLGVLEAKK